MAQNTREGRVLQKLLDRLRGNPPRTGHRSGVRRGRRGLPLEPAGKTTSATCTPALTDEHKIQDRIVHDVSPERFRAITESALEGLAKKELNLSAIVGKSAEAKERRLVPEVIEQFFVAAAPRSGLSPRQTAKNSHVYRIGKVPRNLLPIGDRQEARFGRLGREYGKIVFDKALLPTDPTLEWVTPGHPLFEAVRDRYPRPRRRSPAPRRGVLRSASRAARPCSTFSPPRSRTDAATRSTAGFSSSRTAAGEMAPARADHLARHHAGPGRHAARRSAMPFPTAPGRAIPLRASLEPWVAGAAATRSMKWSASHGTWKSASMR